MSRSPTIPTAHPSLAPTVDYCPAGSFFPEDGCCTPYTALPVDTACGRISDGAHPGAVQFRGAGEGGGCGEGATCDVATGEPSGVSAADAACVACGACACVECPQGYMNDVAGVTHCKSCAEGKYAAVHRDGNSGSPACIALVNVQLLTIVLAVF